jgi:hypothetical protein
MAISRRRSAAWRAVIPGRLDVLVVQRFVRGAADGGVLPPRGYVPGHLGYAREVETSRKRSIATPVTPHASASWQNS